MSNTKKIMIGIIILLLLIASYLVYKRFTKPKPDALIPAASTPATASVDKDALRSELAVLTPRLAAEKYKLYNMEQYAARLKANPTTAATTLNAYYNDMIVPQQKAVGDLEAKIGQISTVLNA